MKDLLILGIESSCDETACAVVRNGKEILSSVVSSQIEVHTKYGGVVPEIASRMHIENITPVLTECLEKASVGMEEIDAIAVTYGPGLIGCLHVGVQAAKTLAWYYQKPLVPVHHLAGHIYANAFVEDLKYPLLALVVSGGNSELVLLKEEYSFEILGQTQDDAVGEAYDKVARVLGLGYPGGVAIDKLAQEGKEHYTLPRVHTEEELDFSFSGLKSAVLQLKAREEKAGNELNEADLAYCFQHTVVNQLMDRVKKAYELYHPAQVVLGGGVAANSLLRQKMTEFGEKEKVSVILPPMKYCTDNAAMIALVGTVAYRHGVRGNLSLGPDSSLEL